MSLKQSMVVKNRFTVKSGGQGSRGSSPGAYVEQYMGREDAVERIPPVRVFNSDSYMQRYMARQDVVDKSDLEVSEIRDRLNSADKAGGVAFGYGSVSMSDESFKAASRDIQAQFDKGKTVMETVVSFTDDYLKETGVVSPDFELTHKGAYKGNVDQLRLRMGIMAGMDKMSRHFDDLQYVGCIQVDTRHVHCHLAMVDKGKGNLGPDGKQRGKITNRMKQDFRRGADNFFDGYGRMKSLTSSLSYDRRNMMCYMKKFTYKALKEQGFSQFLLASLPEDKRLWRADSQDKSMEKPNAMLRGYVTQVLRKSGSGYDEALSGIKKYAKARRKSENLSRKEYREICKNGRDVLISDCMNSVYSVLKSVPDSEKVVATPMMRDMARRTDDIRLQQQDDKSGKATPLLDFGMRLRRYKTRLDEHKKSSNIFHRAAEALKAKTNISESARPVLHYIDFEAEYQTKLACKYQHFLGFLRTRDEYEEDFKNLKEYKAKMERLEQLRQDARMTQMSPREAEEYGQRVYDMHGGRFMSIAPDILSTRQTLMQNKFDKMRGDFERRLFNQNRSLVIDRETGEMRVADRPMYDFEDVKALDLHRMGLDFSNQVRVSDRCVQQFVVVSEIRNELYNQAEDYLVKTNQNEFLEMLPGDDVRRMHDVAENFRESRHIAMTSPSDNRKGLALPVNPLPDVAEKSNQPVAPPAAKTLPLGKTCRQCQRDVDLAIRSTVQTTAEYNQFE